LIVRGYRHEKQEYEDFVGTQTMILAMLDLWGAEEFEVLEEDPALA